jgi:hypothetical protein
VRAAAFALVFVFSLLQGVSYAQTQEDVAISKVKVYRNRLSVELQNAEFGSVMDKIAGKAGFDVSVSKEIYDKKLNTSFKDIEIQRGINRLLGLISQKNFFIYYGPDGEISKIEVFGQVSGKSGGKGRTMWQPEAGPKPQGIMPLSPPLVERPLIGQEKLPPAPADEQDAGEATKEEAGEVPYIPPTQVPEYIPPSGDRK